jgi:hypothetical protein
MSFFKNYSIAIKVMLGTNYKKKIKTKKGQAVCGTYFEETKCILCFCEKSEGKRQLERPGYRWEDNIKHTYYKSWM